MKFLKDTHLRFLVAFILMLLSFPLFKIATLSNHFFESSLALIFFIISIIFILVPTKK